MAKLIDRKLEGSTLMAVLIAMVIIVVIFTIAMQVFANVMRSGVSSTKIKVENQMRIIAGQVKSGGRLKSEELVLDSIRYQIRVEPATLEGISQLEIIASQRGNKIAAFRCLFMERNNEED